MVSPLRDFLDKEEDHFFGINKGYIFTSELPRILPFMGPGYLDRYNRIAPLIWAAWLRARARNPEGFAEADLQAGNI